MDPNSLFPLLGFLVLINALILYLIIGSATKATARAKYEWAQMELLAKIARAQGVPEEEIRSVMTQATAK